jgi:hypothetical protein
VPIPPRRLLRERRRQRGVRPGIGWVAVGSGSRWGSCRCRKAELIRSFMILGRQVLCRGTIYTMTIQFARRSLWFLFDGLL